MSKIDDQTLIDIALSSNEQIIIGDRNTKVHDVDIFIQDVGIVLGEYQIYPKYIYQLYENWKLERGGEPLTLIQFFVRFAKIFPKTKRKKGGYRVYFLDSAPFLELMERDGVKAKKK